MAFVVLAAVEHATNGDGIARYLVGDEDSVFVADGAQARAQVGAVAATVGEGRELVAECDDTLDKGGVRYADRCKVVIDRNQLAQRGFGVGDAKHAH